MKRIVTAAVMSAAVIGAVGGGAARGDDAALYKVADAQLITDFGRDLPVDDANVSITVVLPGAVRSNVGLSLTLNLRDGKWKVEEAPAMAPATVAATTVATTEAATKPAEKPIVHPAGVVGLFAPLQVGYSAPAMPQKGEAFPRGITYTRDGGLKGNVTVRLMPLDVKTGRTSKRVYEEAFFDCTLDLKPTGKTVPAMDPDPSTPPWRKNNTRAMGRELKGTFTATPRAGGTPVQGEAVGG